MNSDEMHVQKYVCRRERSVYSSLVSSSHRNNIHVYPLFHIYILNYFCALINSVSLQFLYQRNLWDPYLISTLNLSEAKIIRGTFTSLLSGNESNREILISGFKITF